VRLEIPSVLGLIGIAGVVLFSLRTLLASGPIIVNTTADPSAVQVCTLRDAITAANTQVAANGCASGTGTDTITISVSGTFTLSSALPAIANASSGSITIDERDEYLRQEALADGGGVPQTKRSTWAGLQLSSVRFDIFSD